jgi:hypothetical protein
LAENGGQPQISINGEAWESADIGPLVSIGNGRYYADVAQEAVSEAGLTIESRYKSDSTAECPGTALQVVSFDPNVFVGLSSDDITKMNYVFNRVSQVPGSGPVIVVPNPAADEGKGVVYGYFGDKGLEFYFELTSKARTASGARVDVTAKGVTDSTGKLEIILDRNDMLNPTGTKWNVVCYANGFSGSFSLEDTILDLNTL